MNRREFIAASSVAGLALTAPQIASAQAAAAAGARDYYELRVYSFGHPDPKKPENPELAEAQKKALDAYWKDAAIPAYNRIGIKPVGAFYLRQGPSPLYILLRHQSLADLMGSTAKLLADADFVAKAKPVLEADASNPPYQRLWSSLLIAFTGAPTLETPVQGDSRVYQLRIYESPSIATGQKKIEMFNTAEIAIFRASGMNPVIFGECLAGPKMPNLTYMLGFKDEQAQADGWKKFVSSPEWKQLSGKPEYADKKILCGITNLNLKPAEYSQL